MKITYVETLIPFITSVRSLIHNDCIYHTNGNTKYARFAVGNICWLNL